MQIIKGVFLLELDVHDDNRGSLVVLEENTLPFNPRRIFFITVPDSSIVRAGHAIISEELIVPVAGAVTIDLDNGEQKSTVRIAKRNQAIWIRSGIWLKLREFEPGTILLVAASLPYAESGHLESPRLPDRHQKT